MPGHLHTSLKLQRFSPRSKLCGMQSSGSGLRHFETLEMRPLRPLRVCQLAQLRPLPNTGHPGSPSPPPALIGAEPNPNPEPPRVRPAVRPGPTADAKGTPWSNIIHSAALGTSTVSRRRAETAAVSDPFRKEV